MRPLALLLLLASIAHTAPAAEPPSPPSWPLWDGAESVEQYARRAGLEATRTLDLGNGVKLEMVLIPAGKFVMGTEEPKPVDETVFEKSVLTCLAYLVAGLAIFLSLASAILVRAFRERRLPRYYLGWLLVMTTGISLAWLGATRWWVTNQERDAARAEYQGALARYNAAGEGEKPAHEVTLTKPYYIGRFEVMQEQYEQIMGVNPSQFKGRDLPVECVSWEKAQAFCKKASEKTGVTVRLPTDAEWEYGCRAGTKTNYYTGDAEADLNRAGWNIKNSNGTTHPVGQKAANAWGVYDMHGNVGELCADWCEDYRAEATVDPQGPAQGQYRVVRGGSWGCPPTSCRFADRDGFSPGTRGHSLIGFRVVGSLPRTP